MVDLSGMNALEALKTFRVVAVIRADDQMTAREIAEACIDGGIKVIEVTFSFRNAENVIAGLAGKGECLVGAGTVLSLQMAELAAQSGARFIASPHTDKGIISYSKSKAIASIAGALTSSEIVNAWNLGADLVKIFPVKSVGGPSYVKAIRETLPFVEIMTTGGVTIDNFADFLSAGASVVGLSSDLIGSYRSFDREATMRRARTIAEKLEMKGKKAAEI